MIPVCEIPLFFRLSDQSKAALTLYQARHHRKRLSVLSWHRDPERYEIKPQIEEGEAEKMMIERPHSSERIV